MRQYFFTILILFLPTFFLYGQEFDLSDLSAKIEFNQQESNLNISASLVNMSALDLQLDYELLVFHLPASLELKKDTLRSRFNIEQEASKELVSTDVSFGPKDELLAIINIYLDNKLVSGYQDTFVGIERRELTNQQVFSDGEGVTNVIINQTKTRIGQNFHDGLFTKINLSGVKFKQILTLDELPSLGQTTRIILKVDNDQVFEFNTNPNQEYMDQMLEYCFQLFMRQVRAQEQQQQNILY